MAQLEFNSRSLAGQYVIYELDSQREGQNNPMFMRIYTGGKNALGKIKPPQSQTAIISNLFGMANAEAKKEVDLLNKVFGVSIHFNPSDPAFYIELIKALNTYLNIKEVVERNIARIKAKQGQISIVQHFPGYFTTAYNAKAESMYQEILNRVSNISVIKAADFVLSRELPIIVEEAITAMFNSKDFIDSSDEARAYKELISTFGATSMGSDFARQLYSIYNIDELKKSILEQIEQTGNRGKSQQIKKFNVGATVNRKKWSDGGLSLEAFENFVINAIVSGAGSKNVKIQGHHTGASGIKADNIITFDIDTSIIEESLRTTETVSRQRNVAMLEGLSKKLSNLSDSFIIYSNAKNYTLGKNFKGFSSGSNISLETFGQVVAPVQQNIGTFLGAIANTIPGAIGQSRKKDLEGIIATDIAYLLFDDISTIGVPQSGAQALHLLNLDGIYIPLSYFLFELASAIESGSQNPQLLVKAVINTPSGVQFAPGDDTGIEKWETQRFTAQESITIGATFLQNFSQLIGRL